MRPADRDSMRERRTGDGRQFRPPESRASSLLVPVLCWLVAGFLLFKAFDGWENSRASRRQPAPQPVHALAQKVAPAPAPQPELGRPGPPGPEMVRKCIRDGAVTYSNGGCAAGATSEPVQGVPAAPPAPSAQPATTGSIYLCKAYDGGTFWAQAHCNQHRAHIDRIARVPEGLRFEQQVRVAEQQMRAARAPVFVARPDPPPQDTRAVNKARCQALEDEIKHIDVTARQPLPPQLQDHLAARRKEARGEQFRLRC